MKGFGIYVKNTLLEDKHRIAMGESVWLYLWLLDRMTSISEDGIGKILGGKPIKHTDFSDSFSSLTRQTYTRYVERLREAGYIDTLRTPYGLVISLNKAEKIFGNNRDVTKKKHLDVSKNGHLVIKNDTSLLKNDTSNKTIQLDNTMTIQDDSPDFEGSGYRKAREMAAKITKKVSI
jgi:hypothetical protein